MFSEIESSWVSHTLTGLGGVIGGSIGTFFWAWGQLNARRAEGAKVDKTIRLDAYEELSAAMVDMKRNFADERAESRRESEEMRRDLSELRHREVECMRESAIQKATMEAQGIQMQGLRDEVSRLTLLVHKLSAPLPTDQGAALFGAVKGVAQEAVKEAAETKLPA